MTIMGILGAANSQGQRLTWKKVGAVVAIIVDSFLFLIILFKVSKISSGLKNNECYIFESTSFY